MSRQTFDTYSFTQAVSEITKEVVTEVKSRSVSVKNELRNSLLEVMQGQRSGRLYRRGAASFHQASAPAESPAWDSGGLARSFKPKKPNVSSGKKSFSVNAGIESGYSSGPWNIPRLMEHGTRHIAPRPFRGEVIERAKPEIERIMSKKYL